MEPHLSRVARQRGRWYVAILCSSVLKDGIVNAGFEYMEVIMMANNRTKPVPSCSVTLASIPGLLVELSRRYATLLNPLLPILGLLISGASCACDADYLVEKRRLTVWARLPAGVLMWLLTYLVGMEMS